MALWEKLEWTNQSYANDSDPESVHARFQLFLLNKTPNVIALTTKYLEYNDTKSIPGFAGKLLVLKRWNCLMGS